MAKCRHFDGRFEHPRIGIGRIGIGFCVVNLAFLQNNSLLWGVIPKRGCSEMGVECEAVWGPAYRDRDRSYRDRDRPYRDRSYRDRPYKDVIV